MNEVISYEGIEIPDFGERLYPYGVIEVTKHCNLRCKTCFFFQAFQHPEKNLSDDQLITKLKALQRRHRIKFVSWVGGEPLLRRRVIDAAPDIFPMGVIFTNGQLPIPNTPLAIGVSLDGPADINDEIRGQGVYQGALANITAAPRPVFIQCVVTQRNFPVLEPFTAELATTRNITGIIFSVYVPQVDDDSGLAFSMAERSRLIDGLLAIKDRFPDFVMNERAALELARPDTCKAVTDGCDMKDNSLALDYRLNRRQPCCYGERVDCDLCAAPTPFSLAVRATARKLASEPTLADRLSMHHRR